MRVLLPPNEDARLEALYRYQILDTLSEDEYNDITYLASRICETPIALITFVDRDRQWFKSAIGFSGSETPREVAFCAHTILEPDLLEVADTLQDERFHDNPFVFGEPHIRFYAGAPLITEEGHALGTLCVLDREPRELTDEQRALLRALSRQVMAQLELRLRLRQVADNSLERMRAEEALRNSAEQALRHQSALLELARSEKDALLPTLEHITRVDAETLSIERVSVWLFNDDLSELVCESLYERGNDQHQRGIVLRADQYPRYFQALQERRVIAADDARNDPNTREFAGHYLEQLGITSMLDVPIWRRGRMVGVVCHEHVGPMRKWTPEEQDFAASIADMVSLTMEASERAAAEDELRHAEHQAQRLAERMRAVAAAAAGVIGAESQTELRSVLEEACREVLPFDSFFIQAYDAAAHTFRGFGGMDAGVYSPSRVIPADGTPGERVVRERRTLITHRASDPDAQGAWVTGTGRRSESVIRAPILNGREVFGFIAVHSYTPGLYTGEDAEVLEAIASLAANALENIRLEAERRAAEEALRVSERQAQQTADRMRAVAAAAAGVIGAESLETLQDVLCSAVQRVISFDAFTFALYDAAHHTLSFVPGMADDVRVPAQTLSAAGGPSERVIRERRSLVTLRADDPAGQGTTLMGTGRRSESVIRSPIISGGRVLGVISVQSYTPDLYAEADVEVLEAIASLAANALENIRLEAEQRTAEAAVRISESRFRTMFEQFPLSLQIFSPTGETLQVNQAWSDLFRMKPEEVTGFNPLQDPQLQELSEYMRRGFAGETLLLPPSIFDSGKIGENGAGAKDRGGPRWIQAFICPVREEDGSVREVFMIHQDITQQREAEEVLRRSHEELEQLVAERTSALEEINVALEEEITWREQAEEELRQKTSQLEAIIQALPDLFFRLDSEGRIVDFQAGPTFGAIPASKHFLGKHPWEAVPPEIGKQIRDAMQQVRETGELVCIDYSLPGSLLEAWEVVGQGSAADGNSSEPATGSRDFEARMLPLCEDQSMIIIRDITDRKEAERALQRSEEHFRRITENSSDVASILNGQGVGVYHSPSVERVLGYPVNEILGTSSFERIHPDDHEKCRTELGAMFRNPGVERTVEFRYLTGHKGWRVLEVIGRTLLPDSAAEGVIINARDVTDRRETEEALRRSEESYRGLFDTLTELVYIQDLEGRFVTVNEAVVQAYGYSREELAGQTPAVLADPERVDIADTMEHFRKAVAGEPQRFEWWGRRKDGSSFPKEIVLTRSTYFGQDVVIAVARDISERKQAEEALRFQTTLLEAQDHATIDGILVSQQGHVLRMNNRYADIFNVPEELRAPERCLEMFDWVCQQAANPAEYRAAVERLRHDPAATHRDEVFLADGRVLDRYSAPLKSAEGHFYGRIWMVRDITERKQVEEALRESEARFRTVVENLDEGLVLTDLDDRVLYVNPRALDMFGYTAEALTGKIAHELLSPVEERQGTLDRLQRRRQGVPDHFTHPFVRQDGTCTWIEVHGVPFRSSTGEIVGTVSVVNDVTERKEALEALQRSEQHFRSLIDGASDLITIMEVDGTVRFQSRVIEELFGYTQEELIGENAFSLVHPDDLEATRQAFAAAVRVPGTIRSAQFRWRHKDGSWRIVEAAGRTLSPLSAAEGIIVNSRDITERKQAEEEIRLQKTLLEAQGEASIDGILVVSEEGKIISYNRRFVEMWKIPQEVVDQHSDEAAIQCVLDSLEDPDAFLARVAYLYENRDEESREEVVLRDGRVFDRYSAPVKSSTNQYYGRIWFFRDITERKQFEAELIRQKAYFEGIIGSLDAGVAVFDNQGRFEFVSRSAFNDPELRQWVIGKTHEEYSRKRNLPPEISEPRHRSIERALTERKLTEIEQDMQRPDGSVRHMLRRILPLLDESGEVVRLIGYSVDITERKQAEEKLREATQVAEHARQEAERANRAKSEFLSRMSHELRTPMNSILGFAQLIAKRDLPADQRKGIDHILKAGRHLLNLINEVLDIARIEANRQQLSLEPVRVSTLLQESLSLIRPLAAQRDCQLDDAVALAADYYVQADRQKLAQVMLNLLSNAVKYNRPQGWVRVSCEEVRDEDTGKSHLRIGVHDTGRGIPADRLDELFVPFSRLGADQSEVEGTGLGLALSKRLVEAMGGDIQVESQVGEGSTFWIELPLVESPIQRLTQPIADIAASTESASSAPPATILYIEDNLANLTLIEAILGSRPEITLVPALQGGLGLDLAWEHDPDLILLDLHLPDIPGQEVLHRLRSDPRTEHTPVIIISADATPRQIDRLTKAGVHEYITKPLDIDQFLEAIDRVLNERDTRHATA